MLDTTEERCNEAALDILVYKIGWSASGRKPRKTIQVLDEVLIIVLIIIIIHFENIYFFHATLRLDVCPYEVPPHIPEYCPISKPSTYMPYFTHSLHVWYCIPPLLSPATSTFIQVNTQSSTLLRFRCPNHLNLPYFTTSATLCIPKRLYNSTLRFLFILHQKWKHNR